MTLWILDTDCVSLFQQSHPWLKQRINQINPQELAVTVITVEEQMRGWLKAIRANSQKERIIWAYQGLRQTVEYFNQVTLLDFDLPALTQYQGLIQQQGLRRIGTQDLKIGAIALSRNAVLVTRNRRHFEQIPGLLWEDWTIAPEA
ncbi:type II toxin-antitoxin system VapC family toxin [Laspinema sp. D1]|uniref:Type II toxin-antitoxin system VapC family toxin n=1 Tax=Laspinema palackyanum D2a TaxID=2953684 RepID=A0ABT2MPS1_9CYAN|nr:type II toxin-antitoxin system VapC family toxin [Laspinema sp. D2a]